MQNKKKKCPNKNGWCHFFFFNRFFTRSRHLYSFGVKKTVSASECDSPFFDLVQSEDEDKRRLCAAKPHVCRCRRQRQKQNRKVLSAAVPPPDEAFPKPPGLPPLMIYRLPYTEKFILRVESCRRYSVNPRPQLRITHYEFRIKKIPTPNRRDFVHHCMVISSFSYWLGYLS